jgi:hypothetical protein
MKAYDPRNIDRWIIIVREIRRYLFLVEDTDFQDEVVKKVQFHHSSLADAKPVADRKKNYLPGIVDIHEECQQVSPASFPSDPLVDADVGLGCTTDRARDEAKRNLQWSDLVSYNPSSAREQDAWVAIGRINRLFWEYAVDLGDPSKMHSMQLLKEMLKTHSHATKMVLGASSRCAHVLEVELTSCNMLVVWIAYCWAHRTANDKWPLFLNYSAVLDPHDLMYLVLQDKSAIDALGHVRAFLQKHRRKARFPFREQPDTLILALEVGRQSGRMTEMFAEEQAHAETQISDRWEEI